jgi:hypothetical protein
VHLQHVVTVAAINLDRINNWQEDVPQARTRTSRFARLVACQNSPAVSGPPRESPDPGLGLTVELARPAGAF